MMHRLVWVVALCLIGSTVWAAEGNQALAAQGLSVLKELLGGDAPSIPQAETPEKPKPVEKITPPAPVNVAHRSVEVCKSEEELSNAILKAIEPYKFPLAIREDFADGEQTAAVGGDEKQYYFYFLGRIDEIEKIPAADMDAAMMYYIADAMLPPVPPRTLFYQRGSKMLAFSKDRKGNCTISWYMNNEKKVEYTMTFDNHYTVEQVTLDNLDSLDRMSFHMFDLNKVENLAVFLLKGESRSFLFLGRVPVEKAFINGNKFPVAR